jgi:hypothetical protein
MSTTYFDEAFESFGYWWTPGNIDDPRPGQLRYDPASGLRLMLLGTFEPPPPAQFPAPPRYPILLGRTTDSRLSSFVTLIGCGYVGGRGIVFSIGQEELTVQRAYFGAHLETDDELRFERADVYLDYLEHWVTESELVMNVELEHDVPVSHEVRYDEKELPRADVGGRTIELRLLRRLPFDLTRSVTVSEVPFLEVRFDAAEHIETIMRDTVFPLQNLSSLASDHVTRVTALDLRRGTSSDAIHVQLLYAQLPGPTGAVPARMYAQQMLVTTRDISLDRLLTAWVPFATTHRDLCDLYFSVVYSRTLLLDARFSMLAQVAEAYHRDRIGGTERPDLEFQKLRSEIVAAAPEGRRSWLNRKLGFANELSLQDRLHALVKEDRGALEAIIGNVATFVSAVVNTRNYMAHRTAKLQAKAASGSDLYQLNERLRLLVKACFLRELDATADERRKLLARHVSLDRIVRANAEPTKKTRRANGRAGFV